MIVTTMDWINPMEDHKVLGYVTGSSMALLTRLFPGYGSNCDNTDFNNFKRKALDEMKHEAECIGADGIIHLEIKITKVTSGDRDFMVCETSGVAVKV